NLTLYLSRLFRAVVTSRSLLIHCHIHLERSHSIRSVCAACICGPGKARRRGDSMKRVSEEEQRRMSRKDRRPFGLASRRPAATSSRLNDSILLSRLATLPCIESPGDQHRRYESSGNALMRFASGGAMDTMP